METLISLGAHTLGSARLRDMKTHLNKDFTVYTKSCGVNVILLRSN